MFGNDFAIVALLVWLLVVVGAGGALFLLGRAAFRVLRRALRLQNVDASETALEEH